MEYLELKYKNFLKQQLESEDFEEKIEAKISLKNFKKFLKVQQEILEKNYYNN